MPLSHPSNRRRQGRPDLSINPVFTREPFKVPRDEFPATGIDPDIAYQILHDELMLDGNARLNLATFVTTWMEPQATTLMTEAFDKNMIDKDEYPRTADLELRCVRMLAGLWHARDVDDRSGARPPGPAKGACWPAWRSNDAGNTPAARLANPLTVRTS
jgi:glutamate decarboxylase